MPSLTPRNLKRAIEHRDAGVLAGFYADDALLRIIDKDHPPSAPMELHGRAEIARFYDDVCGRAMTHKIESAVGDRDHLAFSETCAYEDGMRVFCTAMLTLQDGQIAEQTTVQAWDA
jgi:hypothetical protein